jgi:tripartite-type tricarboxylate transporter receptor subunit TctC
MNLLRLRAILFGLCTACAAVTSAAAEDPFYKGKRLTILINFAPGGPSDIEGRLLAKHLAKHIDGQPLIIVQNKDGAGGLVGTNFVGEVGPRDGTMAGFFTGAAWKYVMEPENHRVDFSTFEFIGFQPGNAVYYARADLPPGLKQGADILKATGLVAGGLAVESSKDLLIRATLELLGVPYKYVTGYRSSATARLALQRGEIHLHSESTPAFFSVVEPSLVKPGTVIPLYYDANYDGETFSVPKVMEGSSIPPFQEFYRKLKGTMPSGRYWDAYRTNLAVDSAMLRTVAMPPGSPQAAVDALRVALGRLNDDKDYADDSMKAMQFVPHYETGATINARVRKAMAVDPAVRSFVLDFMKGPAAK